MPEFRARHSFEGQLFSGRGADRIMLEYENAVELEGARTAERLISQRLERVLRNPTGYYQSQIAVRRDGGNWAVNDNNVIYGPWLEGTGSRNQTTRFKGYRTFRLVAQQMERQLQRIGERLLNRFVGRL